MTVPTISNLPTVPATSDPNFETEAPALFNHIKNTFVSEMNSAISFINSSTFDATVEFKNANFTAARNFLYMIDTSSAAVSVTLPANPSTGDQLLLMDQKRSFATNNLTIGRNSQNINGAASDVVSKSTGALIRCIFQSSYGWTVDLYEGQWESGYTAGDLVYTGGNVGIGTTAPSTNSNLEIMDSVNPTIRMNRDDSTLGEGDIIGTFEFNQKDPSTPGAGVVGKIQSINESSSIGKAGLSFSTGDQSTIAEKMRITSDGEVELPKLAGRSYHLPSVSSQNPNLAIGTNFNSIPIQVGDEITFYNNQVRTVTAVTNTQLTVDQSWGVSFSNTSANGKAGIGFNTKDTERMRITADGNVGIGDNLPDVRLEIAKANTSTGLGTGGLLQLTNTSGSAFNQRAEILFKNVGQITSAISSSYTTFSNPQYGGELVFATKHHTDTEIQEQMRIDSQGKVGIGVGSPSAKLTVNKGDDIGFIVQDNTTDNHRLHMMTSASDNGYYIGYASGQSEGYKLNSSGDSYFLGGNIGIGTNSPSAKLDIGIGASNADGLLVTSSNDALVTGDHIKAVSGRGSTDAYNLLNLENSTGTQMIVQGDGKVGIGTSSPREKFYVATGEAHVDYASTPPLKGSALRLATNTTHSFICSNQYFGTDGTGGGGNGVRRARNGGCGNIAFDTTSTSTAGDIKFETSPNSTQYALATLTERMRIKQAGDVQISTGNLVIGTAGKGIDFSATSGTGTSELLTDYEQGTFTPAFIDTNGDASFTHDVQKGRYTKIGDCVYFQLFIGTDAVTEGTGNLKISGLPFTAQNTDGQLTPSSSVGLNYSWDTSPIKWSIASNSDAIILYKSVNPLTPSASTDLRTTANTNRISIEGFYHV